MIILLSAFCHNHHLIKHKWGDFTIHTLLFTLIWYKFVCLIAFENAIRVTVSEKWNLKRSFSTFLLWFHWSGHQEETKEFTFHGVYVYNFSPTNWLTAEPLFSLSASSYGKKKLLIGWNAVQFFDLYQGFHW